MNSQQHPPSTRRHRPDCKCDCDRQALAEVGVLDEPEFRSALSNRDMQIIIRLLQRYGFSQRRIASMTGQSQSEISEILCGRRVHSYEVLVRVAEGLGIPRGWTGLAYDTPDGQPPQQ
jgi:antitoxin component HigA of HigAB toxin-antitoxin module